MIKVLIVEDDPMVSSFNSQYVESVEGFEVASAVPSVDEAVAVLDRQQVDLILLDIFMPGNNGLELLEHLRKTGKNVDVILITAASDVNSIKKALQQGAADYLIKPFEFTRFHAALTAYRDKVQFMQGQMTLSQQELDRQLLHKRHLSSVEWELPKGLTQHTLRIVWNAISGLHGQQFSTEELAKITGVSRISIRKYLHFLEQMGVIDSETIYGSVGRPICMYSCIRINMNLIDPYL